MGIDFFLFKKKEKPAVLGRTPIVTQNDYVSNILSVDINEVNNQLQKHDDQKRLLDRDIVQCLAASDEMLDKKDDQIKIARSSLDSATAQLKSSENMLKETNDVLNQLKDRVENFIRHNFTRG